ncbi:MAG: hypothetical protein AAB536_00320 [Patescibacteria group bacterium]
MNKSIYTIVFGVFAAAALAATPFYSANSKVYAENNCDFRQGLKNLSMAGTDSRENYSQENVRKELDVRKEILNLATDCAIGEALEIQSNVKSAQANYPEIRDDRNRILSRLDEIISYYRIQKDAIKDLGIEGSKIFSANLRIWRDSNYVPMDELGKNFLIFAKNQDILQITQNRFNQISLTLKTLGLADNQKISDILNQARKNLRLAGENNDSVKNIFKRLAWPNDASDLMVSSLRYLKDAYQNFFDISKEAQEIISSAK